MDEDDIPYGRCSAVIAKYGGLCLYKEGAVHHFLSVAERKSWRDSRFADEGSMKRRNHRRGALEEEIVMGIIGLGSCTSDLKWFQGDFHER